MTQAAILYDPDCGFCRVCVAVILRWDRRGRLRPVPGEARDSWRVVLPDGSVGRRARVPLGGGPKERLRQGDPGRGEALGRPRDLRI